MLSDPLLVVAIIAEVFDSMGVRYLVGGSLASSLFGVPRATQDVDLVAELMESQVDAFVSLLLPEFYVDDEMIREAIGQRSSFNVIHLATMFKADVFIYKQDLWSAEEFSRIYTLHFDFPDGSRAIRFSSPEDTLLHKLVWYRLGNEISDRQWNDIMGVLSVQGNSLDFKYLHKWADYLKVKELFDRALHAHQSSESARNREREQH